MLLLRMSMIQSRSRLRVPIRFVPSDRPSLSTLELIEISHAVLHRHSVNWKNILAKKMPLFLALLQLDLSQSKKSFIRTGSVNRFAVSLLSFFVPRSYIFLFFVPLFLRGHFLFFFPLHDLFWCISYKNKILVFTSDSFFRTTTHCVS